MSNALVMELVEGEDLSDRDRTRGRVPLDETLPILKQIADALAGGPRARRRSPRSQAGQHQSPRSDGTVKVLDFGLAKAVDSSGSGPRQSSQSTRQRSRSKPRPEMVLGTAAYISPEQARGKPVDHRADVWAFGCVRVQMLIGHLPFGTGETVSDSIAAILTREPDWKALPPDDAGLRPQTTSTLHRERRQPAAASHRRRAT